MIVNILDIEKNKLQIEKIKQRSNIDLGRVEESVREILNNVKNRGNKALIEYANKFDNVNLNEQDLVVSKEQIKNAYSKLNQNQIVAIKFALSNIKKFAELQMPRSFLNELSPGIKCGTLIRPIDSVGCYIPGGNYPLPSTTLMTVIPAKVAGVKEIIVVTPPQKNGVVNPAILVASDLAGATKIILSGGAQGIAAIAYGTKTIPKVNKIVGPGNKYVTVAKKLLYGEVGIDMLAGPSEVLIIAKEDSNPKFIAADMLAQAEHDVVSCALLLTDSKKLANAVKYEIIKQTKKLSSKEIIKKSFEKYSCIVLVDSVDRAISFSNDFAPEHLEIMGYDESILDKITNAGSIFFGEYSVESAGDYCSGTNHVLPTGQFSKVRAGLSVYDFLKMPTIQMLTKKGLKALTNTITTLGKLEGLPAHVNSAKIRFENKNGEN
jgi:histidinol dehydrogenase